MSLKQLSEMVRSLNEIWHDLGQTSDIRLGNEHITVTEKEVIVNMAATFTVTIPLEKVENLTEIAESVSPRSKSRSKPRSESAP